MLFICFLLPLLGAVRFSLRGELTLAEPIVILYALFSIRRIGELWRTPVARRFIVLGLLWLLGLIVTDLYRSTLADDYLRGWSKIGVLLTSYIACASLVGTDLRRAGALFAGIMLAPVLNYYIYNPDYPLYKFVFGYAVSAGAFGLAMALHGERRIAMVVFPIMAGVVALLLDCRSLAGITLSAAAYYAMLGLHLLSDERNWKRRILFGLFWALFSFSLVQLYSALAGSGRLSSEALDKYETQLNAKGGFSVLEGRNEAYFTIPKIIRSPILGWGSWVKDPIYVAERAEAMGLDPMLMVASTDGGLIPAHSHLLGAWLEAGVLGGLFWLYALYLIVRIVTSGWLGRTLRWSGILSFILILFAWDIFFSPFGGERRLNDGIYLWFVSMIVIVSTSKQRRSVPARVASPGAFDTSGRQGMGTASL